LQALFILSTRDQLDKLTIVLALSIGFFGLKGGLFTLMKGGDIASGDPMEVSSMTTTHSLSRY